MAGIGRALCIGLELDYPNTSQKSLTGHGRAGMDRAVCAEGSGGAEKGWACIGLELFFSNTAQTGLTTQGKARQGGGCRGVWRGKARGRVRSPRLGGRAGPGMAGRWALRGAKGGWACIGLELNYSNTSQSQASLTGHGRAGIGQAVGAEGSEGAGLRIHWA